jgi:heavy metal translocating P-type ATPase
MVTVGGGVPLAWSTLKHLARREYATDLIATLAIGGSALLGEFFAGAVVVLMQAGGEALEDYGLRRARRSLDNLLKRAPSVATRQEGDQLVTVPAGALGIGDTILVRPGDIIAADGVVAEGYGSVDEAALTGEPVPLPKQAGDRVFSGTVNLSGNFLVRTTSTAAESKYEAIVRMVQQAQGERAPINRLANRYTPAFTWVALGMAAAALLWHGEPVRALAVLVVATPCPLIIATPLAVLSAVNRAAALNIIVKSGAAIEQAGTVRTVVFDKTGTLTTGEPSLAAVRRLPGGPAALACDDTLLAAIAAVELISPHALAAAVVRAARQRQLRLPRAGDVEETPGTGVSGTVEGRRFTVGSGSYVAAHGVVVPEAVRAERARLGQAGKIVACVGVDRQLTALLVFEDRLRPEAPALLDRLRALGVSKTVMLTGDAAETAHAVAGALGIGDVRAHLQPEDKVAAVRALAAEAPVMMVGDGINDAPALATASVGVAMGNYGAGIATDAADIVITVDNVERVADAIALGRRMVVVARQGILFGMGASGLLMVLAGLGLFPPAMGALLQELVDLAAIFNALRVRE